MGFAFDQLPATTLVGADSGTFDRVTKSMTISKGRRSKYAVTKICQRLLNPLYNINDSLYERLDKPAITAPVFIIGHWRSGTTYIHNLLSCDPQFGYCTTYQTVFPHLMLYGSGLFRHIASLCMPATRPTDSLELSVDQPQEEEFALSNMTHAATYHFWLFPEQAELYRDRYLLDKGCTEQDRQLLQSAIIKNIHLALHHQNKCRYLSKNPPHTARVAMIAQMFPDAKFIYLVRNPYTVFRSTMNFFSKTIDAIALQSIPNAQLERYVLQTHRDMIAKYEREKVTIDPANIIELQFEQFESDPLGTTEQVYRHLNLGDFESVKGRMAQYIDTKRGFTKNRYQPNPRTAQLVRYYCQQTIDRWGYKEQ